MPDQMLYVRRDDAPVWDAAKEIADREGLSLSQVVTTLLKGWVADVEELKRRP